MPVLSPDNERALDIGRETPLTKKEPFWKVPTGKNHLKSALSVEEHSYKTVATSYGESRNSLEFT